MTTTPTTTDRSALVAHDTKLVELYRALGDAEHKAASARSTEATYRRRGNEARADEFAEKAEAYGEAATAAFAAVLDHETSYTKWARFYLVTSSDGHIHTSMNCATCFPTTTFALLPELSGLGQAEAVEAYGEILCSVCFPDAPTAWTAGVSKATLAEREARATAKAERDAKRAAKALIAGDVDAGVRVDRELLKTIAAAKGWLTDWYDWNTGRVGTDPLATNLTAENLHPSFQVAERQTVAEALAARTGETVAEVLTAAAKRAAKR